VIFAREIDALTRTHGGYRLHVVETRAADAARARGDRYLTPATLDTLCPDWRERDAYACGPRALLDTATTHWGRDAQLATRLRVERFQPALAPAAAGGAGGRVSFRRSGVVVQAGGAESLLAAAEGAGLRPAHGCRMGICHTCTVTLCAGSVRDLRDGRVVDEPGARVQICVSAAAGACEVEL
jgi:stearoyl-CoA 9-desaturase NADPH oxidoreductase